MVMITPTRRRHLNNNNGTTTPLAVPRGLDPPDNYKGKKHRPLLYSVVSTFLLICTLYHQFLPKLLHEGSHRSMLQTSNTEQFSSLGVRGGMVGIGQSISDSDTDDSSDAHKSLRRLITSTHQVIAVGPAKAAGSSMYSFSSECNNGTPYTYGEMGKFLRRASRESSLTKYYEMPSVVSSHVHSSQLLVDIIKDAPRDTLLLYSHRQETSRLQSAVKQVLTRDCKLTSNSEVALKREGNSCYVSEEDLLEIIKSGKAEIGQSTNNLLTCEVYEAIEDYAPTMVFIDYQKANEIQELISEKYCVSIVYLLSLVCTRRPRNLAHMICTP